MLKKKEKESPEINSGSMADIVFLLLIFFLVTTTIDTDKGITLVLPPKGSDTKEVHKDNLANILINASGEVMLDEERIAIPEISSRAREMIQKNDKIAFSVKTLKQTKYEAYIDVIDQLKRAGAIRISIAEPD